MSGTGAASASAVAAAAPQASAEINVEAIFERARAQMEDQTRKIEALEQLESKLSSKPELFDAEDITINRRTLALRAKDLAQWLDDYRTAVELYKTTVADLETMVSERQRTLEEQETTAGIISAEPELLTYFSKKQALFQLGIKEAKHRLCAKIQEKLGPLSPETGGGPQPMKH